MKPGELSAARILSRCETLSCDKSQAESRIEVLEADNETLKALKRTNSLTDTPR